MPNISADIKFGGLFVQQEFVSNKIPSKSKCICRWHNISKGSSEANGRSVFIYFGIFPRVFAWFVVWREEFKYNDGKGVLPVKMIKLRNLSLLLQYIYIVSDNSLIVDTYAVMC